MLRPLIACALAGAAASATAAAPAAPAAPQSPPSALPWRSALDGYRPFADQPVTPWRQSNDTVREIGGWRAYAREASGMPPAPAAEPAAAPAAPASAPKAAPAAGGHHRH